MLDNSDRNRLVKVYEEFHDAKKVSNSFGVHISTVYRIVDQKNTTGSVDLKTSTRGRKPKLTSKNKEDICNLIRCASLKN